MRNLSALLNRITSALNKDEITKQVVVDTLKQLTSAQLEENSISIKNGVLEIIASPVVKNEIRMKEEDLKNRLKLQNIFVTRILYK